MAKISVGIRDVDKETFIQFKAMTVEKGMKLGEALEKAMERYLEKQKNRDLEESLHIQSDNNQERIKLEECSRKVLETVLRVLRAIENSKELKS